jgi:microcystin-dependent protein
MTWGIANYSTTPASNTAINAINIAPGCPSSSVGPFMRQIMADVASALSAGQFMPVGAILHFPTAVAPAGYANCNAQAINRIANPLLFALIGTTYGAGDGSTTFNVPDIRARSIAGWDSGNATGRLNLAATGGILANTIGNVGGEQAHLLAIAEVPAHNHTAATVITDPGHHHAPPSGFSFLTTAASAGSFSGGATSIPGASEAFTNTQTTGITATTTTSNAGSGTAHNVVQPTIILLPCIKIG